MTSCIPRFSAHIYFWRPLIDSGWSEHGAGTGLGAMTSLEKDLRWIVIKIYVCVKSAFCHAGFEYKCSTKVEQTDLCMLTASLVKVVDLETSHPNSCGCVEGYWFHTIDVHSSQICFVGLHVISKIKTRHSKLQFENAAWCTDVHFRSLSSAEPVWQKEFWGQPSG